MHTNHKTINKGLFYDNAKGDFARVKSHRSLKLENDMTNTFTEPWFERFCILLILSYSKTFLLVALGIWLSV